MIRIWMKYFFGVFGGLAVSVCLMQCGKETAELPVTGAGGETQPGTVGYPVGLTIEPFVQNFTDGKKCLGYYVIVDFEANPKLVFSPVGPKARKPTEHFADLKAKGEAIPYVAINGGYFNGKLESLSLLIDQGVMVSKALKDDYIWSTTPYTHFFPVRAALGRMDDGRFEAAWVYCVDDDNDRPYAFPSALANNEKTMSFMAQAPTSKTQGAMLWNPRDAIGGGPMLVTSGLNVAEENYWREIFNCGGGDGLVRHPRTGIGVTADGRLVIVVCDGRNKRGSAGFTMSELANKLISLGCRMALNLDGGGSSTIVGKDGHVLNMPSDTPGTTLDGVVVKERSVTTAVVIAERR